MSRAWFAALVWRPVIIDEPGEYCTRTGEAVTITHASPRAKFACIGTYTNGIEDAWHQSGRLNFGMESANDIVQKADGSSCRLGLACRPGSAPTRFA